MSAATGALDVTTADLLLVGEDVAAAFLPGAPVAGGAGPGTGTGTGTARLRACVAVHGSWSGWVALEVDADGAEALARRMLCAEEVSADDVTDAVGELANVMGGNVKSLIEGAAVLGIPWVEPASASPGPPARETCSAELDWAGVPVAVRILEGTDPDTTARRQS